MQNFWTLRASFALLLFAIGVPRVTHAHPVVYKGAWSLMGFHQPDMQDWQLLYTFGRKFSFGVDYLRDSMEGSDRYFLIPRVSWLVHRWNGRDYQANIYLYGGIGVAQKNANNSIAAEGAIEADYETRRVYFSAKAFAAGARNINPLVFYQLRAGFAPYEGESGELHSWLIGQAQYFPLSTVEPLRVGPVMRFFYKNVLTEFGVSAKGTWTFNFMVHF